MIQRLRRKLARVRYYSARRRHTIWSRLSALAMVTSIVFAGVVTVVTEQLVVTTRTLQTERGGLMHLTDGTLVAVGGDNEGAVHWPDGRPYAEFAATRAQAQRGWPFPTRMDGLPITLDINVFTEAGTRQDVTLATDDPIRVALEALTEAGGTRMTSSDHRVLADWLHGGARARRADRRSWPATTGAGITWIGLLLAAQLLAIGLARLAWRYGSVRRRERVGLRLTDGRCHRCGYDLRGLEFNARCPECGQLVQ